MNATPRISALADPEHDRALLDGLARIEPELLAAAVEACPVNITIADSQRPDFPLAYVNPAFCRTTGYAAEEAIGRNCRFLQGAGSDPEAVAELRRAIEGERAAEVEFVNYRKDGRPFLNALRLAPVHDRSGRLISFIGIQNDVTKERARSAVEIERQRLEALGQMAGGIAHQLNNLLQPVLTLVSLHRTEIADPEMAEDFDAELQSARQAAHIVHDTLAFARQGRANPVVQGAAETVARPVDFVRRLLPPDVAVEMRVEASAAELSIRIDETLLGQALANLLINAGQAMKGAGRAEVALEAGGDGGVLISVSDQGPGIAPGLRARVLEPFYSTKETEGGSGLGLSVAFGIAKRFGGDLRIADTPRNESFRGCCVELSLPVP